MNGRRSAAFGAAIVCSVVGCGTSSSPTPRTVPEARSAAVTPALAPPKFSEGSFEAARAEARAKGKLLFVDAWAPWCHSCLSMRSFVFPDPALGAVADDFVWFAVDTETPEGEAFVAKHPMKFWPTLFVLDPASDVAVFKWPGTATAKELVELLSDVRGTTSSATSRNEAYEAYVAGRSALAGGDAAKGVASLEHAVAVAPGDHPKRAAMVEALVSELSAEGNVGRCTDVALRTHASLPRATSLATVLATAADCAAKAKDAKALRTFRDAATAFADDARATILADDRSGLYDAAVSASEELGEKDVAKQIASRWATFLEREASRATSSRDRAVFDAHRLLAYLALGEPARALPMLEASAKDFPDDYNPHARIARVEKELGHPEKALAAIERAEARVVGPRSLRIAAVHADILESLGRKSDAAAALGRALDKTKSAALPGGYAALVVELTRRKDALVAR
ncbi:MAG: thioredoxin family protein [Polyangiaceae bacterium]